MTSGACWEMRIGRQVSVEQRRCASAAGYFGWGGGNPRGSRGRRRRDAGVRGLFFFSSRRRHTRLQGDWSSDVCSSDLPRPARRLRLARQRARAREPVPAAVGAGPGKRSAPRRPAPGARRRARGGRAGGQVGRGVGWGRGGVLVGGGSFKKKKKKQEWRW